MAYATWGQAPVAPPPKRRGGRWLAVLGALALIGGVVLWLLGAQRLSGSVADLAPAPVGCETNLDFDGAGTYLFFVETKGSVDELDGDCAAEARDYELDGDALPRVTLTLVDQDGNEVDLDRVDAPTYSAGGRVGAAVRRAELDAGGQYVLTVESNESDVVVRVGRDPARGVDAMKAVGIGLAIAGLVGLLAGLVLSRRRPAQPQPAPSGGAVWQPTGGPPPVAPPNAVAPPSPPYAAPGQWGGGPGGQQWPPQPPPQHWPPQQQPGRWPPQPGPQPGPSSGWPTPPGGAPPPPPRR